MSQENEHPGKMILTDRPERETFLKPAPDWTGQNKNGQGSQIGVWWV